jgi:antitoxin MazE
MVTRTRIIRIGNSKGIRVPKMLLEHAQLPDEVELHAEQGRLIVRPARRARAGWADAAKAMHARGEDELVDSPTATEFDDTEWQWR